MSTTIAFEPRWASAPGESLIAALRRHGRSVEDLADGLGISDPIARGLATGLTEVTPELAEGIARLVGGSPEFWLRREELYRESLQWLSLDQVVEQFPLSEAARLGWLAFREGWRERASDFLEFFDVSGLDEWRRLYSEDDSRTHLRASNAFELDAAALSLWLRQAERESERIEVAPWSRQRFQLALLTARSLTKVRDPNEFIPALQLLCAKAGVALIVLRSPHGVPVSGAARTNRQGAPLIVLSARYLSDDHFWFTFFHEAGHVLLHDITDGYVDALDEGDAASESQEVEADEFASTSLLPHGIEELASLHHAPRAREVFSFAARAGVSPGIVVGQLQNAGVLRRNQLNKLRRRYKWDVSALAAAGN